uniref:NB-ARC domain-containing protein n=1 Tax=Oryza punctata TaxID=4537 RepID=A0A0E0KVE7_ORYPU
MMRLVGSVVDATIGCLVQSILGSFFTEQMEAWTREIGLAEDIEKLEFEMTAVERLLAAAEGRSIDNKLLAQSLGSLRELLYDAEDVMDELDYHRLKHQIEKGEGCSAAAGNNPGTNYAASSISSSAYQLICSAKQKITSWISSDRKRKREEEEPTDSTMLPLEIKHDISKRINRIMNNLQKNGNSVSGVLQLEISCRGLTSNQRHRMARNTRLTTSVPIEPKVYGRQADRDRIIEMLINEGSSSLLVLPIVGIGGIGKTTLARFVYRDQRIIDHFDLQIWICVSTNFNEVRLTLEILEHGCKDKQEYRDVSNFNVLQEILLKNIIDKRFLIILDDMWEDRDSSGWNKLLAPLKCNQVTGCVVLATTRRNSVAQMIGTVNAFQISGLDKKEFWLFFKACTFGNEAYEGPPSLQSIGLKIAKALKGCPLAARSVGALLNRDVSYEHWRTVQDKWKSLQVKDDDIIPILKLSYDYLPFHLQCCFSYCSLFPEDHRFCGVTLVQAWISQNFVQYEDTGTGLEETGLQYLANLVDFGFFQKVGSHYAMHDLMHELAEQVSSNECAKINGLQHNVIPPNVRHLSIITTSHDNDAREDFPIEKFEEILQKIRPSQKLRSLMFFGHSSIRLLKSILTFCKEAKCLRLLSVYVSSADINSVQNSLNPYHLRYLEFIGVHQNVVLPQALTSFYHLQVWNVGIYVSHDVPTSMNNLVNLRHLIAHDKVHRAIAGVGNMASLQELNFKVQNVGGFEIRQLQSMNKLVTLGISHLENVKSKDEANGARLIDKEYLKKLSLSWNGGSVNLEPDRSKDVLEGLRPHHNLKTLSITRYSGPNSPTWLSSNLSVTSLQTIHLEDCREWQILRSPEILPLLRKLKLVKMLNLVELSIPSLEELVLIEMPKLEKCIGTYGIELTADLRVLIIKDCPQLNEFTPFQSYSSFGSEQWFPSLRELTIGCCPHISKWEILPLREMHALKSLELIDLYAVRQLLVPSLQKLVLINMPSLECCSGLTASTVQMSTSQGDKEWLSGLSELTIHDCPCLIVSYPIPPSAMMFGFSVKGIPTHPTMEKPNPKKFNIKSDELIMLDDNILAFHNLRDIEYLSIKDCPNLVSISSEGLNQLIDLKGLHITGCPNFTMTSGLVLPSLRFLSVQACAISGSWLTEMLSHVRSLDSLGLHDCPRIKFISSSQPAAVEGASSLGSAATHSDSDEQLLKIPSNILHSLRGLYISNCPDLEFSGEEKALRGYTSLKSIKVQGCPKLVPLLVSGKVEVGSLPPSLRYLDIDMGPELSTVWDLKPQELEQGGNQVPPPPPSLDTFHITNLTDKVQSRLLSFLPTITILVISESPELTSLQLGYSTALRELEIVDCESLASVEGFGSLTNLRSLTVCDLPSLPQCFEILSHQQGASEILSRLEKLQIGDGTILTVSLCKQLSSLRSIIFFWPERSKRGGTMMGLTEEQERALQLLTSLQSLNFQALPNLLSLPANLASLTSLKWLDISDCPRIARLPEMGLPPLLRRLSLRRCSDGLSMQCRMAATEKLQVQIDDKTID